MKLLLLPTAKNLKEIQVTRPGAVTFVHGMFIVFVLFLLPCLIAELLMTPSHVPEDLNTSLLTIVELFTIFFCVLVTRIQFLKLPLVYWSHLMILYSTILILPLILMRTLLTIAVAFIPLDYFSRWAKHLSPETVRNGFYIILATTVSFMIVSLYLRKNMKTL